METGHAKNVANFETVVIILTALGLTYNPSQALILLPALKIALAAAKAALAAVDAAEAAQKIAVDQRQDEFADVDKFAVNIKRAAAVEINDASFNEDVAAVIRKLHPSGKKFAAETGANTPEISGTIPPAELPATRSTSQRSYDNQIAHLADLRALLESRGDYTTNDTEVDLPAIEAKIARMTAVNNAAKNADALLGSAVDQRDEVLYHADTGIIKLVSLIKLQIARKPGKASSAYKQIYALEFKNR